MRLALPAILGIVLAGCAGSNPEPQNAATPSEVVAKVRKAASLVADQGDAGLEVLRDASSEFSWKDTYVFAVNCAADQVLANPAFPERQGGDIKQHTDYNGKQYGLELCEVAQRPGGGWVEYIWPRRTADQPSRKISYVVSVDGLPYQVGAGIYHESISLEELNQLTAAQQ